MVEMKSETGFIGKVMVIIVFLEQKCFILHHAVNLYICHIACMLCYLFTALQLSYLCVCVDTEHFSV